VDFVTLDDLVRPNVPHKSTDTTDHQTQEDDADELEGEEKSPSAVALRGKISKPNGEDRP
jgi:hypothetical protein